MATILAIAGLFAMSYLSSQDDMSLTSPPLPIEPDEPGAPPVPLDNGELDEDDTEGRTETLPASPERTELSTDLGSSTTTSASDPTTTSTDPDSTTTAEPTSTSTTTRSTSTTLATTTSASSTVPEPETTTPTTEPTTSTIAPTTTAPVPTTAPACAEGDGRAESCPFPNLAAVPNNIAGRYWFDFGSGPFEASVAADEGGAWLLVLQYHHKGGTNPTLRAVTEGRNWPTDSSQPLGSDLSSTAAWGHVSQAAARAIPEPASELELRWLGVTSAHDRVVHFRSPVLGQLQGDGEPGFLTGGVGATFFELSGHTAHIPAGAGNGYIDRGDQTLTEFPFYAGGKAHWGIRGQGRRWEVDDYTNGDQFDTIHRVWIRHSP